MFIIKIFVISFYIFFILTSYLENFFELKKKIEVIIGTSNIQICKAWRRMVDSTESDRFWKKIKSMHFHHDLKIWTGWLNEKIID